MKKIVRIVLSFCFLSISASIQAVPEVTGDPVIVEHLGKIIWPQDTPQITPYLTQFNSSDINDLHGDLDCDFIISTAGNYHFALLEAMQGRADLGFEGWQTILKRDYGLKVCWSTSPPVSVDQAISDKLQFKNIIMHGKPALAMGPNGIINQLLANGDIADSKPFLRNKGNAILMRADKIKKIKNICDLGNQGIRVVTPNNTLERGSFGNFSSTIYNIADQNDYRCDATELFNSIFSQDLSKIDTTPFASPTDIEGVLSVFGRGDDAQGHGAKWVASSRIMHRDIPYALCYDLADAGVIFFHQAMYLKQLMAETMNCKLEVLNLPGNEAQPSGNRFATLRVAKILNHTQTNVLHAQDAMIDFFVNSPVWTKILEDNYLVDPSPNE